MEITLVAHYIDDRVGYGMSRYSCNLLRALQGKGLAVRTIASDPVLTGPIKSGFDFFFYLPIRCLADRSRTDLYHFTVPQVGLSLPLFRKLRQKKIVSTIYDLNPALFSEHFSFSKIVTEALRSSCKNSDALIAISTQTKDDLVDLFGIEPEKISAIPLGADPRFRPMEKKESGIFTVGYVGSFATNKDVPFLIRAYSIFEKEAKQKSRLVLYGKGAQSDQCVRLAKSLDIKNIEFKGFAPDDMLAQIYNSFDVFAFPSMLEGFGLPIIEAQRCLVPTIVRESAKIPSEVTALSRKAKDEEHLADLLMQVQDKGFRYSQEDRQYLEQFTWENCAEKTIQVYKTLLEK